MRDKRTLVSSGFLKACSTASLGVGGVASAVLPVFVGIPREGEA